jgi:hypothetical protein
MSKKITDENGNTYVQKKPFYKRVWFIALAVIVVLAIASSAATNGNTQKSTSSSSSSSQQKAETSSSSSEATGSSTSSANNKKWSQADYDSLQQGDIMNNGAGGANMDDIIKTYGKPSSSTDSSVNNMSTRTGIWTNTNGGFTANVTLSFMKQPDGTYLLYSAASSGLK